MIGKVSVDESGRRRYQYLGETRKNWSDGQYDTSLNIRMSSEMKARVAAWAKEHRLTTADAVRVILEHEIDAGDESL